MFKTLTYLVSTLSLLTITSSLWANTPHPFEQLDGLKRFDKTATLPGANKLAPILDIKGVHIGDNVLTQAIQLAAKGGELGRIRGGYRSDKIKLSFFQAYQNSRLEQRLELYFDKTNGFIEQVNISYFLQDAYLDISPIREQTLQAAVAKYGEPLTMQQAHTISQQPNGDIKFDKFVDGLKRQGNLHPLALAYFQQRNIARSTKLVAGQNNYALMHSGFDRCYLWQGETFNQLLTFCFFDKNGANMNSRGIELNLFNFPVVQKIEDLNTRNKLPEISL